MFNHPHTEKMNPMRRELLRLVPDAARRFRSLESVNRVIRFTLGARAWRDRIPDAVWRRSPIVGDFRVEVPGRGSFEYRARGEPLGKVLFWKGIHGFEPGTAAVFASLAPGAGVFLDVGAYSGYYTLLTLTHDPSVEAYCFEPVASIRAWLREQVDSNRLTDRVEILAAVAANVSAAEVPFFEPEQPYLPGGSMVEDYGGRSTRLARHSRSIRLDDFVAERNLNVGLVKIDTEGAEDRVLEGSRKLLAAQRPWIVCEILTADRDHLGRIERCLGEVGYRFAQIRSNGLLIQDGLAPDPSRKDRNFLLWPEERDPFARGLKTL